MSGGGAAPDWGLPAPVLARQLIGALLLVDGVGGVVVETEAYDRNDPASHSCRGQTARNAAMFGPVGRAYVYRSYGVHWCLNLVCGPVPGGAVLIRALEPVAGLERMRERTPPGRGGGAVPDRDLCRGPGRLCRALGVSAALDGAALDAAPFAVAAGEMAGTVSAGPRVGITRGVDTAWRFCREGSAFLSRPASWRPPPVVVRPGTVTLPAPAAGASPGRRTGRRERGGA